MININNSFLEQGDYISQDILNNTRYPTNPNIKKDFFTGKDDLSMLGQGPIKKVPVRRKNTTNAFNEEESKEIIELFGENYQQPNF